MTSRFAFSLSEQAIRAVIDADDVERRELLRLFETLCRDPGCRGADRVIDAAGRANEVTYIEHFRVVYWPDDAVKEVRITDIRRY